MSKKQKPKCKPVKRGPKEERLKITGDIQAALTKLIHSKKPAT